MGRGLGSRQLEVLAFLRECWAKSFAPTRTMLMDRFVVDRHTQHRWERREPTQWRPRQHAHLDSFYPGGLPGLTPPALAESYRRAVRGLVDRGLVLLVADAEGFYRYADPDAPQPLLLHYDRTGALRPQQAKPCARPRNSPVNRVEQRRQRALDCLPADGSWIEMKPLLCAFLLADGYTPAAVDAAQQQRGGILRTRPRRYLVEALRSLTLQGLAETGAYSCWDLEQILPRHPHGDGRVEAARRIKAP